MSSSLYICLFLAILNAVRGSGKISCGLSRTSQQTPNHQSWHVKFVYSDQKEQINPLQCTGTILNDRFVITAAHCLFDLHGDPVPLPSIKIQSVNNVAVIRSILRVYLPNEFNIERMDDNIVLLKFDRPLTFNSYVSAICFNPNEFLNSSESLSVSASSILESKFSMDIVNFKLLQTNECNRINSLIFNTIYVNSLCVGQFNASQTFHRKAGNALMINIAEYWFIEGVVLYTTGSSQDDVSFAGAISLEPYAAWINNIINRHLKPSLSEQKCQEYSIAVGAKEKTFWLPSVLLLDNKQDFFKPACYASLISEQFLLTAAQCKPVTRTIFIQFDILDIERYTQFAFYTMPSEPNGIALIKLPSKPRRFNLLINCLRTEVDTPIQFVAQLRHALGHEMEDFFRAEYVPMKPIKLVDIKQCSDISEIFTRSEPGDVITVSRNNETLQRIVGLSTTGFRHCRHRSVESIAEKLEWIEKIVWGNE